MAEYSSPISGGLNVARSTVSSRTFTGRAMAPIGPDPTTTALLSKNEIGLTAISNQLGGMAQQMNAFGASLERISFQIASDSSIQAQRDSQKVNQERILAEQQLREGKESIIERKIQGALISPVTKVAAKAQFTLARLMSFFGTLLGGWLLNQGIETIRALSEGNTKKLEDIRDNVLKNLGIIGGIYLGIRTGLFGLINASSRIVGKIAKGVAIGLFVKPVQALIDAIKGAGSTFTNSGAGKTPTSSSGSGGSGGTMGNIFKSMAVPLATGAIDFGLDVASGEEPGRAAAGTTGAFTTAAAGAALGGKVFGPLGSFVGGLGGYAFGKGYGKSVYDAFMGKSPEESQSQPSTTKTPPADSLKLSDNKKEGESKQDFSQDPKFGTINVELTDVQGQNTESTTSEKITPQTKAPEATQATIAPIKTAEQTQAKVESVGPLPEPPPTVVAPPPPAPSAPAPSGPSGSSSPASTVPSFPTSNPDNFYVLYSQVHYNVVM